MKQTNKHIWLDHRGVVFGFVFCYRESLWPFFLRDSISRLFSQKDYPEHRPNTVVPEYACAQHSKYACLLDVIRKRRDVPRTDAYAWVDFGYFRYIADNRDYCLTLPEHFNTSRASFNQVGSVCVCAGPDRGGEGGGVLGSGPSPPPKKKCTSVCFFCLFCTCLFSLFLCVFYSRLH